MRALLLPLDCSILPLIRTLYCWVLNKEVSSAIFKVFGMTRPGIEPRSPGPLANTLPTQPMSRWMRENNLNIITTNGKRSTDNRNWGTPKKGYQDCLKNILVLITATIIASARGVMVVITGMDTVTRVQILDENDCISHSTNTLGKVWIQLFSLQLWVNSGQTGFLSLGEATSLGEGKLWIQNLSNSA